MPVNLSIKNVPDDIAQRLRERAKRNHRSLQGELLAILEEKVGEEKTLTPEEVLRQVRAMGLKTPDEATAMIREMRDKQSAPRKLSVNEVYEHAKQRGQRGLKTASDSVEIIRELRDGRNSG